jgi:hypothetical protein
MYEHCLCCVKFSVNLLEVIGLFGQSFSKFLCHVTWTEVKSANLLILVADKPANLTNSSASWLASRLVIRRIYYLLMQGFKNFILISVVSSFVQMIVGSEKLPHLTSVDKSLSDSLVCSSLTELLSLLAIRPHDSKKSRPVCWRPDRVNKKLSAICEASVLISPMMFSFS